jgi:hypothetical protein
VVRLIVSARASERSDGRRTPGASPPCRTLSIKACVNFW